MAHLAESIGIINYLFPKTCHFVSGRLSIGPIERFTMSQKTPPPITPGPPPIGFPSKPNPPRKRKFYWKIAPLVVAAFAGFMIFRGVQMVRHSREHPRQAAPGEAAFRAANKQIISNKGTTAFGNNSESIALGNDYAKGLKILREGFFTKKRSGIFYHQRRVPDILPTQ